ncbi:MAG: hypothetical protein HGA45_41120 [Chloroflexales bacterium]|nr:hypothetical protein [Chloroflexales bacterium]
MCALCGAPLRPPTVATRTGGRVHLGCAERAARIAWRQRRLAALVHALIIVSVVGLLTLRGADLALLAIVSLAWLTLHSRLHRRVWHYVGRDLRRWLLGRLT